MDLQETVRQVPRIMGVLFEENWGYLMGMQDIAEATSDSVRVVLTAQQAGGVSLLSVKCGLLKQIPTHPDLSEHIHSMNPKMFFGRFQLHSGADGTSAVTCEHYLSTQRMPYNDVNGIQTLADTVQIVVERCAYVCPGLRSEFGGRPFDAPNDGVVVVACG